MDSAHGKTSARDAWQTAVVYPDSTDTLAQNGTTKVWTIATDFGDHVSTQYDRLGRTDGVQDRVAPGGFPPGAPTDPNVRN